MIPSASPSRLPLFAVMAFLCLGAGPGNFPAPGKSRTEIEGCLDEDKSRKPAKPIAKDKAPGDSVTVDKHARGLVITQELQHASCLQGSAKTTVESGLIKLTTTLRGISGRGLCHSTITTTLGLSPGTYRLRVIVSFHGEPQTTHTSTVTLP